MRAKNTSTERHLNLANETEHRYLLSKLQRAGVTKEKFPETYKALDKLRDQHKAGKFALLDATPTPISNTTAPTFEPVQTKTINKILNLNKNESGKYLSSATSYAQGGTLNTVLSLTLHRQDNHAQIGAKNFTGATNEAIQIDLDPTNDPGVHVYALLTAVQITSSGSYTTTMQVGASDVTATWNGTFAPVKGSAPTENIVICMWRNFDHQQDCDYWNNSSGKSGDDLTIAFPMQGSISFFHQDQKTPIPIDLPPTDCTDYSLPMASITVIPQDGIQNPACKMFNGLDSCSFWKSSYVTINNNTVTWNIPHGAFTGKQSCLLPGSLASFNMTMLFSLMNGHAEGVVTMSSLPQQPGDSSLAYKKIPTLQVLYGCLLEGTQISMNQGGTKSIEYIQVGDQLQDGIKVTGITNGTEPIPMYFIEDDMGHKLWLTNGHPVKTENGIVLAKELKIGTKIYTQNGLRKITNITTEIKKEKIYNLKLSEVKNLDERTFWANGFSVGDSTMQEFYEKQYKSRQREEDIVKKLPPEWLQDYFSSLELRK